MNHHGNPSVVGGPRSAFPGLFRWLSWLLRGRCRGVYPLVLALRSQLQGLGRCLLGLSGRSLAGNTGCFPLFCTSCFAGVGPATLNSITPGCRFRSGSRSQSRSRAGEKLSQPQAGETWPGFIREEGEGSTAPGWLSPVGIGYETVFVTDAATCHRSSLQLGTGTEVHGVA